MASAPNAFLAFTPLVSRSWSCSYTPKHVVGLDGRNPFLSASLFQYIAQFLSLTPNGQFTSLVEPASFCGRCAAETRGLNVRNKPTDSEHVLFSSPRLHPLPAGKDLDDGCQRLPTITTKGGQRREPTTDSTAGDVRPVDHPASVERVREERLRAWVEYQTALGPEGSRQPTARPLEGPATGEDRRSDGKEDNGGGGGGKIKSDKRETDRGGYREYGGIGVLMLDVWGNQPWRLDEAGMATAKGGEDDGPGFHPRPLLSKR